MIYKLLSYFTPSLTWNIKTNQKVVFLTFDDGPQPEATPFVLDILKKYNVKATFFVVGANVEKYPELYNRIKDEGHSIGNHSYTHLEGWKTSKSIYKQDVDRCNQIVNAKIFRPPYGRITPQQILALKKDYQIVMWNKLGNDFVPKISQEQVVFNCTQNLCNGDIIVLHDSKKTIQVLQESLPIIIENILKQGFEFKSL